MQSYSISFTRALDVDTAARELQTGTEHALGGPGRVAGGLVFATAAAGKQGVEVARLLCGEWPDVELMGTSFEGLVFEGRAFRHEPALALLGWSEGDREPVSIAFEPAELEVDAIVEGILAACGRTSLSPCDLVLLFPDAHGLPPIEPMLAQIEIGLGRPALAGAGAAGIDGAPCQAWVAGESWPGGGLLALVVPGGESSTAAPLPRVSSAGGSRLASPWIRVTARRQRWIDGLDGEPALTVVRRELGLAKREPLERHLGRILVRHRRPAKTDDRGKSDRFEQERYIVGVDGGRDSFSIPVELARGDEIALAWPDASIAREALSGSLEELGDSPWILQFMCRARDERLHGDADLESAWVASRVGGRSVLGTIGPYQIGPGPDPGQGSRLLVHASVFAALV